MQMLFIAWLYGQQNQVRPMFPRDTPQEDLIRASKSFDLAQQLPPVDWSKALWHLPVQDIIKAVDGPHGIFADAMPVATGGRMIQRAPNDPAWYKGGLYHDNMPLNVPGLWFMSWYDVSVGPNLALYNHVRKTAPAGCRQSAVGGDRAGRRTAPTRARPRTPSSASAAWATRGSTTASSTYGFFDRFLKGEKNDAARHAAEGHLLHDGLEQVAVVGHLAAGGRAADDVLPRRAAARRTRSTATASLTAAPPDDDKPDSFTYDPMNPGDVVRRQRLLHGHRDQRRRRSTSARWRRGTTSSSTRRSRSRKASRSADRSSRRSTSRRTRRTPTSR